MADSNSTTSNWAPSVGDELLVPVVQSPSRCSYFPDQALVFPVEDGAIELILLRQEISVKAQKGRVNSVSDGDIEIEFQPHRVSYDMVDIAHVRMPAEQAIETAFTILGIAHQTRGLSEKDVVRRLRSLVDQST